MNSGKHFYKTTLHWTGNTGRGTKNYTSYHRSYTIKIEGKTNIHGSSDPEFRGDKSKFNPEELFLASISSCHMLWYLHLCSESGITVQDYTDIAEATMIINKNGSGKFCEVTLQPMVVIEEEHKKDQAKKLHEQANKFCFIANSLNFHVAHRPTIVIK